jgi:hypothetical protein
VWTRLDFQIDDPGYFQYAYESDGKTATATATGDLDCDGTSIVYTLKMTVEDGNVVKALTQPFENAD